MKSFFFFTIVFLIFSCGEDKHTKDIEENTYYSKYIEIYEAYDSLGPNLSLKALDEYLTEFPNAQNAYVFKAWILANNNKVDKIDEVFEEALKYDNTNVIIYEYWAALLLRDSSKINEAIAKNEIGLNLDSAQLGLKNNQTWILLFQNQFEESLRNAIEVVSQDTMKSYRYYRTAAVSAIANNNDSLYLIYNQKAINNGQKDTIELVKFFKKEESIFELYQKLE